MAEHERENWLKAILALQYSKEALEGFVTTEIENMHRQIFTDLHKFGVAPGTACTQCTTANVTRCSPSGFCGRQCHIHDPSDPGKACRPCPKSVCDFIVHAIESFHQYGLPAWINTDARLWCTCPWEMAKCFQPLGIGNSTSASEADVTGLLNVIINNRYFQNKLSLDLTDPLNLFCKARTNRNALFHSGSFQLSDMDLASQLSVLEGILTDPKHLVQHPPAINAVQKMKVLKAEPLIVGPAEAARMRREAEQQYKEDKRRFQLHLVNRYFERNVKIPLSFTVSNLEADVEDVYVPPALRQVHLSHETERDHHQQQQLPDVCSFNGIFYRHSKPCRNIYIKGDAGTGKTSLCQGIVHSWCNCIKYGELRESESFIKNFEYVFYIPLRYVVEEQDLEQMIFVHLLNRNAGHMALVRRILNEDSEKCLILLDGLDEYTRTEVSVSMDTSKGLPLRDVTRRCTIITTTRPWKLEAVRMKPVEMDQLLELSGLDTASSRKYTGLLVECLNKRFGRQRNAWEFDDYIRKLKVHKLRTLPVIIRYLVCLWHDGKSIGNGLCGIFSGILDMLLDMSEVKTEVCRESTILKQTSSQSNVSLPACFSGRQNCQKFASILQSLSRLAFRALFNRSQESRLVFDTTTAEMHGMSQSDIKACLRFGILSQDIVIEQCSVQQKSLSFLHKMFQEFLAALHVYLCPDQENDMYATLREQCSTVDKTLEMSQVLLFLSGMVPVMVSRLSEHLGLVMSGDTRVTTYREWYRHHDLILIETVQDLIIDCMKEISCNGHLNIHLHIEDIVVGGYTMPEMLSRDDSVTEFVGQLLADNNGHIKTLYLFQYSSALQKFTQTGILQKLGWELNSRSVLKSVTWSDVLHTLSDILYRSRDSLGCLIIEKCDLSEWPLRERLQDLSKLGAIRLNETELHHKQIEWLLTYLSQKKHFRQVFLDVSRCTDCDKSEHGLLDLSKHTQMAVVHVQGQGVDQIRVNASNLQVCKLWSVNPGIVTSVVKDLPRSTLLHRLDARQCSIEDQDALLRTIPALPYLKELLLFGMAPLITAIMVSPTMKCLQQIWLRDCRMTLQSICCLIESFPTNQQLYVYMHKVEIIPNADAEMVQKYIKTLPNTVMTEEQIFKGRILFAFYTSISERPNENVQR